MTDTTAPVAAYPAAPAPDPAAPGRCYAWQSPASSESTGSSASESGSESASATASESASSSAASSESLTG